MGNLKIIRMATRMMMLTLTVLAGALAAPTAAADKVKLIAFEEAL